MNTTTSSTPSPRSTLLKANNTRTIDQAKIPDLSSFNDHESRIGEALCLAALLRELICPHWTRHPDYPESKILPFDSTLLDSNSREGLGYIAGRVESVLQECYEAIYGGGNEVAK